MKLYKEVFLYFLKLGSIGFGGPLALIAMMQRDLVEEQSWISTEDFQKVFPLVKSMPGPVAFQMAVFLGHRRAGFWGGFLAGVGLNLPAFSLMILFGYYYKLYAQLRDAQYFLVGMQAAALAMVLIGLRSLFLPYLKKWEYWILFFGSALLFAYSILPEAILIIGGASLWAYTKSKKRTDRVLAFLLSPMEFAKAKSLFFVCAKAGAIVFGTGLAIVPLLEKDFVEKLHWMTHAQFMDALAMGQITPGPVVITATFIGFKELGLWGALIATIAIFAPSFFHMVTWFPHAVRFLTKQVWIRDFSFAASSIIMGTLAITLARIVIPWAVIPASYLIFALCLLLAVRTKLPAWALIPIGGFTGLLFGFLGFFHRL